MDTIGLGTEEAATDTGDGAIEIYYHKDGYFHTGDEILYGYSRLMIFDSNGKLDTIGAESRYSIDDPDE